MLNILVKLCNNSVLTKTSACTVYTRLLLTLLLLVLQ